MENLAVPRAAPRAPDPPPVRNASSENFPVASLLLPRALRPAIRAFYDIVRAADDVADDPGLDQAEKLRRLDLMASGLTGDVRGDRRARHLLQVLAEAGRPGAERHALTMVAAFRADIAAAPCRGWDDLVRSCHGTADPVGRFLLDLHDEDDTGYAASDALCTALQVLNHLQDMGEDWRRLGRVYLPVNWIDEAGGNLRDLEGSRLTSALRVAVDRALRHTSALLDRAEALPASLRSRRLAAEARVILSLARALHWRLVAGDPLARRVTPTRADAGRAAVAGVLRLGGLRR